MRYRYLLPVLAVILPMVCFCTKEEDWYNSSVTEPYAGIEDSELLLEGKTESAKIVINTNMWWNATVEYPQGTAEEWCVLTPSSGYGKIDMQVNCTRNFNLGQDRTATIVIKGNDDNTEFRKEFTLTQKASSPYIEVVEVEQNASLDVPIVKSTNVLSVLSNGGWTAESDKTWCTVNGTGESGEGTLTIDCAINADAVKRAAKVTLKSEDGKISYVFNVSQDDEFSPAEITVVKSPEEFSASWTPVIGVEHYEIIVKDADGVVVGSINAGTATEIDLSVQPVFSEPQYAGYVKLSVKTYSEDESVYSIGNEVESNSHFTSGKGTAAEPFVIGDPQSLANITLANSILPGAYYKLDYTPSMDDFTPVCSYSDPFNGFFDGSDRSISGWNTTLYASDRNCVGFFGAIAKDGNVSGLNFSDCTLTLDKGDGSISSGGNGFGFLAGYNMGTVSDVKVRNCLIKTVAGTSPLYVGAICGENSGKIENCTVSGGRLSAAEDRNKSDEFNCGGITGYNTATGVISSCVNGSEIIGMNYVGGIAGLNDGQVLSCGNTGKITANYYFGGITGYVKKTGLSSVKIMNCYNTGTLVMDEPAGFGRGAAYMGGITSRVHSTGQAILNCFNSGNMQVGTSVSSSNMRIGGIAGHVNNTGTIENCYFSGSVTIAGKVNYGGIVGEFADKKTKIINCYSAATVTVADGASGNINAGLGKCAASVTVASCYALSGGCSAFAGGTTTKVGSECRIVTENELKSATTLSGWDFSSIWMFGADGYAFPQLIGNPHK
ncbi:MAG: BACON domain-containing protein [Candidatus Cryptobacteroides sp.]